MEHIVHATSQDQWQVTGRVCQNALHLNRRLFYEENV